MKELLTREINAIDGLRMWDVDVMPLHFHSEKAPTTSIYRKLSEKGWLMLGLVHPEALTIPLDPAFTENQAGQLITDIRDVTEDLIAHPEAAGGDIRYA